MIALIAKDFAVQKRSLVLFFAIGLMIFFMYASMGDANWATTIFPVFVVGYSFANRTLYEDERNHSLRLLLAFPLPRRKIVQAKYVSIAIVFLGLLVIFWGIGSLFGLNEGGTELALLSLCATLFGFSLLVSLYLPMAFKLGMIKAQTFQRLFLIGLFAIGAGGGFLFSAFGSKGDDPPAWLTDLLEKASRLSPSLWAVLLFAIAVVIYLLSLAASIRLFERRELF
ncbi:ABC-2 transporter permease [Gorillibacterium sp. sgz500922]|uniref:ABC-2 transporter permease n=1 Tax=Gorillibacterium sp. sgz500922 TaxID=3446694 RepID=UPI003F66DC73